MRSDEILLCYIKGLKVFHDFYDDLVKIVVIILDIILSHNMMIKLGNLSYPEKYKVCFHILEC